MQVRQWVQNHLLQAAWVVCANSVCLLAAKCNTLSYLLSVQLVENFKHVFAKNTTHMVHIAVEGKGQREHNVQLHLTI